MWQVATHFVHYNIIVAGRHRPFRISLWRTFWHTLQSTYSSAGDSDGECNQMVTLILGFNPNKKGNYITIYS